MDIITYNIQSKKRIFLVEKSILFYKVHVYVITYKENRDKFYLFNYK